MKTVTQAQSTTEDIPRFDTLGLPLSVLVSCWSLLIFGFCGWNIYQDYRAEYTSVVTIALESYNRDVIYRRWATMHGGVYVPATPKTPPNASLAHLPERDITLSSGKILTLMNPSYMTRQVHEMSTVLNGVRGHLTSLNPLRAQNVPDVWEKEALQLFEKGEKEHYSLAFLDGQRYLRFMRPLVTESGCLTCHAHQGYKSGDIRGGLSISVPWK